MKTTLSLCAILIVLLAACKKEEEVGCSQTTFTDPRDGQVYKIVEIGDQCWFAENLNYQSDNSRCYGYINGNCDTYGRLYDGQDALTVCPSGWHLPSDGEWWKLAGHLGGQIVAGGRMKSTSGLWDVPNTGATNSSKFSGLPSGGWIASIEEFVGLGRSGSFWSSTVVPQTQTNLLFVFQLVHDGEDIEYLQFWKENAVCVRCLKD